MLSVEVMNTGAMKSGTVFSCRQEHCRAPVPLRQGVTGIPVWYPAYMFLCIGICPGPNKRYVLDRSTHAEIVCQPWPFSREFEGMQACGAVASTQPRPSPAPAAGFGWTVRRHRHNFSKGVLATRPFLVGTTHHMPANAAAAEAAGATAS